MIAKQYSVLLPTDYDMQIIRRRVADRGEAFDSWPGLGLKAFLITERARGATANRYAPFYLWNDVAGANEFLFGDGFAALSDSFGRPLIEHWLITDTRVGDTDVAPISATREDRLVGGANLGALRDAEHLWLDACVHDPRGLYAAAVALDPYRWQTVRFALWHAAPTGRVETAAVTTYEVLHLSRPGLDALRG
jgi:hypothetical protein